jgi:hypothetical protein
MALNERTAVSSYLPVDLVRPGGFTSNGGPLPANQVAAAMTARSTAARIQKTRDRAKIVAIIGRRVRF